MCWLNIGVGQNNGNTTDNININMVLDHPWLLIRPQSFLEWTRRNFEFSLVEFNTALHEEHLQVALEAFEVGICSSL
jgi:hypothetical protein